MYFDATNFDIFNLGIYFLPF